MSTSGSPEVGGPKQERQDYLIRCPGLPLAVYREIAAHLRQVRGVTVTLLPQRAPTFDYGHSQVGGLVINYGEEATAAAHDRVEQILAYYGDRFRPWESILKQ